MAWLAPIHPYDEVSETSVVSLTEDHPFWDVTTHSWTLAADLKSGDQLLSDDGSLVTVAGLTSWTGSQWMWDLTVDNLHDFFVVAGSTSVLVHNCGEGPPDVGASGSGPASPGLQRQIADHVQKLNDYMQNPLDSDNTGRLANAINNGVGDADSIYYGRIDHLLTEIRAFNGG